MSCLFQWFVIYILWLETFCTTHSNKCFAFYLFVFHLNQCWGNLGCWRCFITGALPVYSEMGQRIFCAPLKKKILKKWLNEVVCPETNKPFLLNFTQAVLWGNCCPYWSVALLLTQAAGRTWVSGTNQLPFPLSSSHCPCGALPVQGLFPFSEHVPDSSVKSRFWET